MREHTGKNFLLGAIVGSSLGALTALVFTTKQGQKLQKEILKKYKEFDLEMKTLTPPQVKKKARKTIKKAVATAKGTASSRATRRA